MIYPHSNETCRPHYDARLSQRYLESVWFQWFLPS